MKTDPTLRLIAILSTVLITGCCSAPTYRFVTIPASVLPAQRTEAVWFPDQVAPYSIGRYVDPRDPSVIHEAHTLYRREQSSRPNLTPPEILVMPPFASTPANNATTLLRDALTAELNQQRASSQALIEQAKSLANSVRQLNTQSQEFRDALQESARVQAQLREVNIRLQVLESQLRSTSASPPPPTQTNLSDQRQ